MSQVTASLVKELRDRTGLGMMECKRALAESGGDIDKAIDDLRKSSGMKAAKKAGRTAADGVVSVRAEGGYGIVVEVNSETDFVARDEGFQGFVGSVVNAGFTSKENDIATLMAGDLESDREALVQKIGENISPRRAIVSSACCGWLCSQQQSYRGNCRFEWRNRRISKRCCYACSCG